MTSTGGPDFLCIGAPKTGTTWLYKHLCALPEIWMPPVKELHYFDRLFPLPKYGEKVAVRRGLFGAFPGHKRRRLVRVFARGLANASLTEIRWGLRYFGRSGSDEWYRSLFEPGRQRISGEMTTDYCALPLDGVRYIRAMLPEVRVIFLMRDPIERAWSHAKMLLPELLGKPLSGISTEEFLDYLAHPGPLARGDYVRILQNWENVFPPGQIYIDFVETLSSQPERFLRDVLEFVGAARRDATAGLDFEARVNPGSADPPAGMPAAVAEALARRYLPDLQALAGRFQAPVSGWLRHAEAILDARPARLPEAAHSQPPVLR